MKNKKAYWLILAIMSIVVVTACRSIPKPEEVPNDLTVNDLTLRAQQEFDAGNYAGARAYYDIILDRFSDNEAACIQANFEIGHIYIKQKKWEQAIEYLEPIVFRYAAPGSASLPQKYYILAKNDLELAQSRIKK